MKIERKYGISDSSLYKWKKQYDENGCKAYNSWRWSYVRDDGSIQYSIFLFHLLVQLEQIDY